MKTALLIDVSNSIQTDFKALKDKLKLLINAALPFQEIAIYTFSSTTELVQDYSTDVEQLENTIDNLELRTSSTDFYGAVVTAANSHNIDEIQFYDHLGQKILRVKNGFDNIDVSTFAKGTYLVKVISEAPSVTKRLLIH